MKKKAIFAVVTLGLSLFSGQAADEVIFEDKNFSKDGWSDFRDISNGAGWEVRSRELGGLVQGVVQEVSVEGDGGVYLSSGSGSFAAIYRMDGMILAIRMRDGEQSPLGQAEVSGKAVLLIGFDGAFFIYEYRTGDKWTRLG